MQLSIFTLTAPFLAMAALNNHVYAAKPKDITKSTCIRACMTSATQHCPGFDSYKQLAYGAVVTTKEVDFKSKMIYGKKKWYFRQTPNDVNSPWFGGHVNQDGAMSQWIVGTQAKGKKYVIKYTLKDTNGDHFEYFWMDGAQICTAPALFLNYASLTSASVMTS